jgi:hypothetical protein
MRALDGRTVPLSTYPFVLWLSQPVEPPPNLPVWSLRWTAYLRFRFRAPRSSCRSQPGCLKDPRTSSFANQATCFSHLVRVLSGVRSYRLLPLRQFSGGNCFSQAPQGVRWQRKTNCRSNPLRVVDFAPVSCEEGAVAGAPDKKNGRKFCEFGLLSRDAFAPIVYIRSFLHSGALPCP